MGCGWVALVLPNRKILVDYVTKMALTTLPTNLVDCTDREKYEGIWKHTHAPYW